MKEIIEQKLRWQDADEKQASAIYHKRLNKGYDSKAANCLAGPLGSCRYEVVGLTEEVVKTILPAGHTLRNGVADVLLSAVIWAYKDANARVLIPINTQKRIADYEAAHGEFTIKRQRLRVYTNREIVKIVDDLGNGDVDCDLNEKMDLCLDEVRSVKRK